MKFGQVLGDIETKIAAIESADRGLAFLVRRHVDIYARHMPVARVLLKEANHLPSKDLKMIKEKGQQLPRYKRPRRVIFGEVPRSPTGKIEKPKLRAK